MFLRSDEEIQKILVENNPASYKQLLFLADFGRYFEIAKDEEEVLVCTECLHLVTPEENQEEILCYQKETPHKFKSFNDEAKLQAYIKKNIDKHYVKH